MVAIQESIPRFLAGDVILFAGQGDLYSKVGRWLMRGGREGPTYAVQPPLRSCPFPGPLQGPGDGYGCADQEHDDVLNRRYRLDMWRRRGFEVWRCESLTDRQREALARMRCATSR